MDTLKKLKLEYKGIKDVISHYTSRGNIINFLNELEQSIDRRDLDSLNYSLTEICKWYDENIGAIHQNQYVFNSDEHDRNKALLKELKDEMMSYVLPDVDYFTNKNNRSAKLKILISHKSDDKKYGDALEKIICGLGIRNDQLIYTSHPLHKIPLDKNIFEYLRENIYEQVFVIFLCSNAYLDSPACLNEMGAAWVVHSDYTNIYTPDFTFENSKYYECAVDTRKMGIVLNGDANCKAGLFELKNKILKIFDLTIDEQTWAYLLDHFIEDIK